MFNHTNYDTLDASSVKCVRAATSRIAIDAFRVGVTSAEAEPTSGRTDDTLDTFSV
jgi:hypothetical protein